MKSKDRIPKIHNVCGNDDLRPNLQYAIVTEDGLIVATNANIMTIWDAEFWLRDIDNLKGKLLHRDTLVKLSNSRVKSIEFNEKTIVAKDSKGKVFHQCFYNGFLIDAEARKYELVNELTGEPIICKEILNDKGETVKLAERDWYNANVIYPNWKRVFPNEYLKPQKFDTLVLNPKLLLDLMQGLGSDKHDFKMQFYGTKWETKKYTTAAIACYPSPSMADKGDRSWGIIMPSNT